MKRHNTILLLLVGILFCTSGNAQQSCESVYLQIHSQWLVAGDTLAIGVMVMDPCEPRLSELSDMVYVELWADETTPVFRTRVLADNGIGTLMIPLDSSLPSGYYLLRAYTRYMRNFPEYQFFRHWIQVFQPSKPPALVEDGELVFPVTVTVSDCGPLLIDQPCKVLISLDDVTGAPSSTEIKLVDSGGNEVSASVTDSVDLFVYEFVPKAGERYRFQVKTTHESWTDYPLPAPTDKGIRLQLRTSGSDPLIEVISGRENDDPNLDLILRQAGIEYHRQPIFIRPGATTTIPLVQVARVGVTDVLVQTGGEDKIVAAMTVLSSENQLDNSADSPGSNDTAGPTTNTDQAIPPILATSSRKHTQGVSLKDYLRRERGIPGYIPSHHPDESIVWIDQWTPLEVASLQSVNNREFRPENGRIILEGQVKVEGNAVEEEIFFAVPGDPSWTRRTRSDSTGYFRMELEHIVGQPDRVILRSPNPQAEIALSPSFAPAPSMEVWPSLVLEEYAYDRLLAAYRYQQIHEKFLTDRQEMIQKSSPDLIAPSYGTPGKIYRFEDYTRMPTEEAFIEFIPEVYLKKREGRKQIFLLNTQAGTLFQQPPLLLIDGVPVFSSDVILSTNYRLVDRIELLTEPFFLNGNVYSGVLNLITFQKDASTIVLNPGELRAELILTPVSDSGAKQLLEGERVPNVSEPGSVQILPGDIDLQTVPVNGGDRREATEIWIQGFTESGVIIETKVPVSQP